MEIEYYISVEKLHLEINQLREDQYKKMSELKI